MINVELLSLIRRWRLRDQMSIRETAKRTSISRNTIKKKLRNEVVTPQYMGQGRTGKLSPYIDKLQQWLNASLCASVIIAVLLTVHYKQDTAYKLQ